MDAILLAIAIAVTPTDGGQVSQSRIKRAQRQAVHIEAAATRHNVSPLLLVAMIHKESSFRTRVKGLRGELGLMQLLRTGGCIPKRLSSRKAIVPSTNIMLGAKCLARYIKRCKSISAGLNRYNGRGCTRHSEYSDKVMDRWEMLEEQVSLVAHVSQEDVDNTSLNTGRDDISDTHPVSLH